MPRIREKQVLWKEKDGVVTVLLLGSGAFCDLNAVGSAVWKLLAAGQSVDAVIDTMAKTYDAPREQLGLDVHGFVANMLAAGLLEV